MTYTRSGRTTGALDPEYVDRELIKIQAELREPDVRGIHFEKLHAIPKKYAEGDLYYGIAGVFGGSEGLYIRDAGNWRKL